MSTPAGRRSTGYLLGLSTLILAASLLGGAMLILQPEAGGFFSGLGNALGLLLIGVGNLVSWILHLFCWYMHRMRWLGIVLLIQSVPAIFVAGWLATMGVDAYQENQASDQRATVYSAIESDDVLALQQSLAQCGQRCQRFFSFSRALMLASLHRSHMVARYLLEDDTILSKSASSSTDFYDARTSLYTCEGRYLPSLGALDLAVANDDTAMLLLLWPASDDQSRSRALWTAARLDRLDMVRMMTGADLPSDLISAGAHGAELIAPDTVQPLIRESHPGMETLLPAAASGAALDVGSWLLDTRPIDLPQSEIQRAMDELLNFATDTASPRSLPFGHLLLQHGADIQSAQIHNEPALERAVRIRSKAVVSMLLSLGADTSTLSDEDTARLNTLLDTPDQQRTYGQNAPGCVRP